MDINGRIKAIFDTVKVSERFSKRDFVLTIEENSPYPQYITFQVVQDKCSLLDQYNIGDEIKVYFDLRGREWTNPEGQVKYFNTLNAWKIEKISGGTSQNTPVSSNQPSYSTSVSSDYSSIEKPEFPDTGSDINDLPF